MRGESPLAGDWLVRLEFHYSEQERKSEGCGWNKFFAVAGAVGDECGAKRPCRVSVDEAQSGFTSGRCDRRK